MRRDFRQAGIHNAPRSPKRRSIIRNAPTSKVATKNSDHEKSQARLQAAITELEKIISLVKFHQFKGLVTWLSRGHIALANYDCERAPAEAKIFGCTCPPGRDLVENPLQHWIHYHHKEFNCAVSEILRKCRKQFSQYLRDHIDGLDATDDSIVYLEAIYRHLLVDSGPDWLVIRPPIDPVWSKRR